MMKLFRTHPILSVIITILVLINVLAIAAAVYWLNSDVHYIACGSDRHSTPTAIKHSMRGMPLTVEYVCLDGDMANYDSKRDIQEPFNTSTILNEVKSVFPFITESNVSIVFGNHDAGATDDAHIMKCADTSLIPSDKATGNANISRGKSGLIYVGKDKSYFVYGVSFYDMFNKKAAEAAAMSFRSWVKEQNPAIPVIVIGHMPIHNLRDDNKGAPFWHKALNFAATGSDGGRTVKRNVIYLHGHNHTSEKKEYFYLPGEKKMKIRGNTFPALTHYTYITAGYMRDNETSTLIRIDNKKIIFTKYKYRKLFSSHHKLGSIDRVN